MYAPDVVLDTLPNGYVLLVGSGDREKPLMEYESAFGRRELFLHDAGLPERSGLARR